MTGPRQNHKMDGSPLVDCPEVEGVAPCAWFGTGICVGCYAEHLFPLRTAASGGRRETPRHGLIRLGTWREILPHEWAAFKAGHGTRPEGGEWDRPDFRTRPYFLITRGRHPHPVRPDGVCPIDFYRDVAADPHALNIQVSCDILGPPGGDAKMTPTEDEVRDLAAIPKVWFRLKTLGADTDFRGDRWAANTAAFTDLVNRLGIDRMRVLETPLRLGQNRRYGMTTPLERAGWAPETFLRCNSLCGACPSRPGRPGENRVLGCAVTPAVARELARVGNEAHPARIITVGRDGRYEWTRLTLEAWNALGGTAALAAIYAGVESRDPTVTLNPHWQAKVREVVQRHGTSPQRGVWTLATVETDNKTNGSAPPQS